MPDVHDLIDPSLSDSQAEQLLRRRSKLYQLKEREIADHGYPSPITEAELTDVESILFRYKS
jgi:hypothetical protein